MSLSDWSPIAEVYDPLKAGSIDSTDTEPHDRAIIRALNAKYKANKSVEGDPRKTIFIARLNTETEEDTLWTSFRNFGRIKRCRLVRDIVTGFSKGYGFIEYEDEQVARIASKRGNKMIIDKAEVFVDMECERTLKGWVPRRFGGGVGGNKKSGQLRFGGKDRPFIKPILPSFGDAGQETKSASNTQDRGDRNKYTYERDRKSGRMDRDRDVRTYRDDRRRDQSYSYRGNEYRRRNRERSRSRSRDRDKKRHRRRQRSRSPSDTEQRSAFSSGSNTEQPKQRVDYELKTDCASKHDLTSKKQSSLSERRQYGNYNTNDIEEGEVN